MPSEAARPRFHRSGPCGDGDRNHLVQFLFRPLTAAERDRIAFAVGFLLPKRARQSF